MSSRRNFLRATAGLGAGLFLPLPFMARMAQAQTLPLLDALSQPKFVNPLPNPLAPAYVFQPSGVSGGLPLYDIRMEQIVHDAGLVDPASGRRLRMTAWGYGTPGQPAVYPGYTFNVRDGQSLRVQWSNGLAGVRYPDDVPVDQTMHWADPLGNGVLPNTLYTGPVPTIAHRHGGNQNSLSDGLPEGWYTPGNAQKGRLYSPLYTFDNRQEAAHLWYHDHALGVTRLNVYMGLAGHYFIRDRNEDALNLPKYPYEVPLVIQDRLFMANGELWYPAHDPDNANAPTPTHMPEMFGDTILVNGVAWPVLEVEPRKYRLRMLNGSDARFYDMQLSNGAPLVQIGVDQGLLNTPVSLQTLSLGPGERADVIVDFSRMSGETVILTNTANAPYPAADAPDPATTGKIMAFRVSLPKSGVPDPRIPGFLRPVLGPWIAPGVPKRVRKILMYEGTDNYDRLQTMFGIIDPSRPTLNGTLNLMDPITENPAVGDVEIWEFHNTTGDAHPVHMHLVDFAVLYRQAFTGTLLDKTNTDGSHGALLDEGSIKRVGAPRIAPPEERGKKDTVKSFPGEITAVAARFTRPGEFVYHCHILSHEEHDMMRNYYVGPIPPGR